MKIYEIDDAIRACVNEETGEVDFEKMEQLQNERNEKIENMALWAIELAGDIKTIDEQIERLEAKKQAVENKRKSIREYLAFVLDGQKFKSPLVSVSCKETESVVIDNESRIPPEYIKTVTKTTVDKVALKKAFAEWDYIAGAHIERKQSVTIR